MSNEEEILSLIQRLRTDQRRKWMQGERRLVEEYLSIEPRLKADKEATLDFLYGEFCLREEFQEHVDTQEYLQRFPQFASELNLLFEVHDAVGTDRLEPIDPSANKVSDEASDFSRCPLCRHPVDLKPQEDDQELICSSCGNSFRFSPESEPKWSADELPTLDKFQLVEVVGRGGFGTVYRGRDLELHRTVAIKLPHSGQFLSSTDEERFVREARNAAQLQHPGIVPVFEVGRSGGLPYLVSEFVEGQTLAELIAVRRIGFRQTANLVEQVARAVQHAHERGVIHRDLKPSNIMLTPQGAPRVMDFGLAKRDAGEVTMTTDGALLGTPAYMSPEQASGQAHEVDGRSDVYALGVILYQLLTAELPFRGNQRMLMHQLLHDEPRPPRSLNDRIPKDLSTICLKAMAKEPTSRYSTARELAVELNRFLAGQPIQARPVGRLGRGWRWCKRNAIVAGLLASIAVILVLGAVSAGAGMFLANRLRLQAEASAEIARLNAEKAEQNATARDQLAHQERSQREKAEEANRFLVGLFQSADPLGLWEWGYRDKMENADTLTAVELVRRGVRQLRERSNEPEVQARMADTLGTVLCSLGEMTEGERLLTESLEYRRIHEQDKPLELATTLLNLGHLNHELARYAVAEQMCREALHIRQRELRPNDLLIADAKFALAWTVADMAHAGMPREDDVEELLRDVVEIRRQNLPSDDRKIALALSALASILFSKGEKLDGIGALTEAMAVFQKHEGTKSASTAIVIYFQSELARRNGDRAEALRLSREVVTRLEPALGPEHPILGMALGNLAGRLRDAGEYDEAIVVMRRALNIGRSSPMRFHPQVIGGTIELGALLNRLGLEASNTEEREKKLAEAESLYDEGLRNLSTLTGPRATLDRDVVRQKLADLRKVRGEKSPMAGP